MRRNQTGLKVSNVLLSLLVVAIFMYLLILAMAQDQVLAKLNRAADFANYSSSLLDARKAKETSELIDRLAEERQKLRGQLAELSHQGAVAELGYRREAARLDSIFAKIHGTGGCRIGVGPGPTTAAGPARRQAELQAKRIELAAAQLCLEVDPQLGGEGRKVYLAHLASAQALSDDLVRIEIARTQKDQEIKILQAEIDRQVKDRNRIDPARVHFTLLEPLETPDWFPTNFVNYPPFIVHVLLTFFSGMFGALLITMVFVVYPSKLRERVSAKLYYKRVFLGGLVAVTVFIVLTGGASILGGSEVSENDANVMSFTAIGLLAGMFSDTVADWLSARAKTMFSSDDDDGKDGGDDGEARAA